MSADRPLVTRLTEPVFPNKPWSPNIAQAVALIEITKGQQVEDSLFEALATPFTPEIKIATRALLKQFNNASPQDRLAIKKSLFHVLRFNIVHTPNFAPTEEVTEARCNLLGVAVAQVGLEMISEI